MGDRFSIETLLPEHYLDEQLRHDVLAGLTKRQKSLPPKWFYDDEGSRLFERITRLPEYYPTRAEREILAARAAEIADSTKAQSLIELGSGSSEKSRILLDALHPAVYTPVDVSRSALQQAADGLIRDYPELTVRAVVGDFQHELKLPPSPAPHLLAFLGGTIGNLPPDQRARFLTGLRAVLERGDCLLLGTDLVKGERELLRAYDDRSGVTAAFNKNLLRVLNRRLGADFNPEYFTHVAAWDPRRRRIEMRLRATRSHEVEITGLGMSVRFEQGEDLLTETSAKFTRESATAELGAAGFEPGEWWTDGGGRYALSLWSIR